jgi:mannose/fructose/N-acetylgalactosamine-specific phosphotransferase system component IIC
VLGLVFALSGSFIVAVGFALLIALIVIVLTDRD